MTVSGKEAGGRGERSIVLDGEDGEEKGLLC